MTRARMKRTLTDEGGPKRDQFHRNHSLTGREPVVLCQALRVSTLALVSRRIFGVGAFVNAQGPRIVVCVGFHFFVKIGAQKAAILNSIGTLCAARRQKDGQCQGQKQREKSHHKESPEVCFNERKEV